MAPQPSRKDRTPPAANTASIGVGDGCTDVIAIASSMPCRARIDWAERAVVITQRLAGTMVLQRIGLNGYEGVTAELKAGAAADAEPTVRLVLRHKVAGNTVVLATGLPLDEAVAHWRRWADRLSVGMLLQTDDGCDSTVRAMLGAVMVGEPQTRRRGGLVRRRPRFAKRRALR